MSDDAILSPRSDFIFKKIFGDQNNADILASFLESVLDLPKNEYDTLTIVDPALNRERADNKLSILDVKLKTKSGKTIDIEIQRAVYQALRPRVTYYAARMITEQVVKGGRYADIKRVVSILIVEHTLVDENKAYHNRYTLYDPKTGSEFTNVLEIDVLELSKLQKNDGTDLANWMQFLKSKSKEEFDMLAQKSETLHKAVGVLMELSADEQTRLLYEAHEKARMDEEARMNEAIEKAHREAEERWKGLVADKEALLAAERAEKEAALAEKEAALAAERAEREALAKELARMRAMYDT